jgi:hypothetical protein
VRLNLNLATWQIGAGKFPFTARLRLFLFFAVLRWLWCRFCISFGVVVVFFGVILVCHKARRRRPQRAFLQNQDIELSGDWLHALHRSRGREELAYLNAETTSPMTAEKPGDIVCPCVVVERITGESESGPSASICPIVIVQVPKFIRIGSAHQQAVVHVDESMSVV